MFELLLLYPLAYLGGLNAAKKLGDSGPALEPAGQTWRASDNPPSYGGGTPSRALPAGYGANFAEPSKPHLDGMTPIHGFERMFLTDDGGVYSPAAGGRAYVIEFYAANRGRFGGIVDTGATKTVLSHNDARRMGYDFSRLVYRHPVATPGGPNSAAEVAIPDLHIGPIQIPLVDAMITQTDHLGRTLLGMTFLNRLSGVYANADGLVMYP